MRRSSVSNWIVGGLSFLTAFLALELPASAHIIVSARPTTMNATNAVLTFSAADENDTAGVKKLEITGPDGFDAGTPAVQNGPTGWTVSGSGKSMVITGPDTSSLQPTEDLFISVTVKQLPNSAKSFFDVVETYSDGSTQNWSKHVEGSTDHSLLPSPALYLEPEGSTPTTLSPTIASPTKSTRHSDINLALIVVLAVAIVALGLAIARGRKRKKHSESL